MKTKKPYADGGAESVGSAQKERSKGRLNVGANLQGTTKIKPIPIDQGKVLTTKIEIQPDAQQEIQQIQRN